MHVYIYRTVRKMSFNLDMKKVLDADTDLSEGTRRREGEGKGTYGRYVRSNSSMLVAHGSEAARTRVDLCWDPTFRLHVSAGRGFGTLVYTNGRRKPVTGSIWRKS